MSTEQTGPEQPTAPIRRPVGARDDEPTQVVETVGPTAGDHPGQDAPATTPLPTSGPPTTPVATSGPAPTAPLPTSGPGPTAPLPSGGTRPATSTATPVPTPPPTPSGAAAGTPGAAATATLPATPDDASGTGGTEGVRPVSRTLRVGTVVWGLVVAVIGAGLVAIAAGARFDLELVLIGLLALAGAGLVAGSVAVSVRRRH